jgi:hypothetical protein
MVMAMLHLAKPTRRLLARAGCLAIALVLGPNIEPLRAAETFSAKYQVAWGHLTLAEAEVSHSRADDTYTLTGEGKTEGVFGLLFDWEGTARTEGLAAPGARRPLRHSNAGALNGSRRDVRVDWLDDGRPRSEIDPPPDYSEVTPVPPDSTIGTTDPFTVLLQVLDTLKTKGRCEAEAKVWDGRRRYNLVVRDLGAEQLAADRPWAYAGPSIKCALDVERIGGFRIKPPSWKPEDDAGERYIWAADLGGGLFVPVRAELDTAFGTVVGRLKMTEDRAAEAKMPEPAAAVQRRARPLGR